MDGAAARLGEFVARTGWQAIPAALRHDAARALLNVLGCALAVPRERAVEAALRVLAPMSGPPVATVCGRPERLDAAAAAFVNALAGNLLDYDDTHHGTVIHPAAPVAAPALACAEDQGLGGRDLLTALVLGAEVACRAGDAVSPGHYARGWHITATCGVFGAAAATARLAGLDASATAHALGIAASTSAGVVENLASAAKNVGVGNAARNGILAARFAQAGYTAAPCALEGPLGWARAAGDSPDPDALTGALGERWSFARNTCKPYPCGVVMHAVIDACLALRAEHGLDAQRVDRVTVRGDALLIARGDRVVRDERDARVSIHHCAAVALARGAAGLAEFTARCVAEPAIAALRHRVVAERDDTLPTGAATVTVRTTEGARYDTTVRDARGSLARPLGDADVEAKVHDCVAAGGSGCDAGALTDAVWSLHDAPSLDALITALRPPDASRAGPQPKRPAR
jgi:2-methylcitrate dehydratase PrpD